MVNHTIRQWMGEATSSGIVAASQFNFEGTILTVTDVLPVLGKSASRIPHDMDDQQCPVGALPTPRGRRAP